MKYSLLVQVLPPQWRQACFYQARIWSVVLLSCPGVSLSAAATPLPGGAVANVHSNCSWSVSATAGVKETFDSNVYLQSRTPLANRASLATSLLPQVGATWNPSPAFKATITYGLENTWFHSESSENFLLQRANLNLAGRVDRTAYEASVAVVSIDGNSLSPIWTGPGGAPATGGGAVRDRRDAAVYRGSFRLTEEFEKWFVRPGATCYLHDFQTEQSAAAGYQNYADRGEWTGGLDAGRKFASLTGWIGVRYGGQMQAHVLQFPETYGSTFQRLLFGLEGSPISWLKLNLIVGPEFRRYGAAVPVAFGDRNRLNLFVDSSVTISPSKHDTITLSAKQFQQPGFGGRSAYNDLTLDLAWRHQFGEKLTLGLGGRAYGTDFLAPVSREDWIFSTSTFVNWNLTKQLNAELSYAYEAGDSLVANTAGRDFQRHLVAFGVKYTFQK